MTGRNRRLATTLAFLLVYVFAALMGRRTIMPGTELALVWPAAGVVAVWFATVGWRRSLGFDVALLSVAVFSVNFGTGATAPVAFGLAAAAVVQGLVFGLLLSRWAPHLWGPPHVEGLRGLVDAGHVLTAAIASTALSAVLGPSVWLAVSSGDWTIPLSWVVRNSVGIFTWFPLGLLVVSLLSRTGGPRPATASTGRIQRTASLVELAVLTALTALACLLVFNVNRELPLPFLLLGASVWVGARFTLWVASVHTILLGAGVVVLTLRDLGPFAHIDDPSQRALVVQAFLALTVLTALVLSIGREESARLNRRLERAEGEASAQATLLSTILDSLADGVTVVGAGGRLVHSNPAAARLLGGGASGDVIDPAWYGVFHTDGRPLSAAEMPYRRALDGERVTDLDLFVRTPELPEGRLLQVSGTPLLDATDPLAVLVFRDVTVERRDRDELASFAGVVAHDLLNPLATVEGWSEALSEEIGTPGGGDADLQQQHLSRIERAARRMRDLINDLLAYTTARDLKLHPVRVDLDALVRDIARSRTESTEDGAVPPVITVGVLPDVLAEPVLLRQVIDNVIGNSVKYVSPGVVPGIEVSARRGTPGLVEIEVSDNGIGIPHGQQASVFDTFHRAHTDGYRGTGLGLSIVKRIVERHGGTITAVDNPRHPGTTMRFTFPAAEEAAAS